MKTHMKLFLPLLILFFTLGLTSAEAKDPTKDKESIDKVTATEKKWYEGGNLHQENGLAWQEATSENKLATCSDIAASMWKNKMLKEVILEKIKSVDDLKPLAKELVTGLDKAFEKDSDSENNKKLLALLYLPW